MPKLSRGHSSVVAAFDEFDQSLLLDRSETEKARARHRDVSDALISSGCFESTFLQGSFARKTMLAPLKDVDLVAVMPEPGSSAQVSPAEAMWHARRAIEAAFPDAAFDVEDAPAKALMVTFPDVDFHVDLVVAYPVDGDVVMIGNRETGMWQASASRRLIRLVSERNVVCAGRFIHQVRMLKAIKANSVALGAVDRGKGVPGLVLETIAYGAIHTSMAHSVAVHEALSQAAAMVRGSLFDPVGESDLTASWSAHDRESAVAEFSRLARLAKTAVEVAATGDVDEALRVWSEVCGPGFPAPTLSSTRALSALYHGGGVTDSGRVTTAATAAVATAPPVRAWRNRR